MPMLATDFIAIRASTIVAARDARIRRDLPRRWLSVGAVMVCLGLSNGFALWVAASCMGLDVLPHLFS